MRWFGLSSAPKPKCDKRFARQYRHSTRVSPDFALLKLRSPSFKSHLFFLPQKGKERNNPQKKHRRQFWCDVSYDQALFCETYLALSTYRASGVQCRGTCMRYITLAICFTQPCSCGVRNTQCTPPKGNPKCICLPSVAERCKEGQEKSMGQTIKVTLSGRSGACGNLNT